MRSPEPNWPERSPPLAPSFYLEPVAEVAQRLLGKGLFVALNGEPLLVEIVEVEAYHQQDPASHSYRGESARNRAMFQKGGTAYVYTLHRQLCLNVVTGPAGNGEAVLIRAAVPLEGAETMRRNRKRPNEKGFRGAVSRPRDLLSGPGRLTHALGIRLEHDGLTFDRKDFKLIDLGRAPQDIVTTTRIGIRKAAHEPLRYYVKSASRWVSKTPRADLKAKAG